MTQSVYKRDFRDPRDLWKFLLNGNEKSNFEDNEGVERDSKAFEELSIKNCYHNKAKKVERTQSDFIINNSKENETMSEKSTTNLPAASKSKDPKKFKISDFPIIIERFVEQPKESIMRTMSRTEYRDVHSHIGSLIIKYKLHNHRKCGIDGKHCEHAVHALTRRQKMY